MVLKLLAAIIAFVAAILALLVEFMWHDKTTREHRIARGVLLSAIILGSLVSMAVIVVDDRDAAGLNERIDGLRSELAPFIAVAEGAAPLIANVRPPNRT